MQLIQHLEGKGGSSFLVCFRNKWKEYIWCNFLTAGVDSYLLFMVKINSEQIKKKKKKEGTDNTSGKRKCSSILSLSSCVNMCAISPLCCVLC